jgi:simple sugar transport system ATP-binding protein
VLLAREMSSNPKLLVAAAPTRGLDVAATEAVRSLLLEAAASGVAVLLISEDLDEVLDLSDRLAVIYDGRIMGEIAVAQADRNEIGLMMAGVAVAAA